MSSKGSDEILDFDATTGAFNAILASGLGIDEPADMEIGPDGNLYIAAQVSNRVYKYDFTATTFSVFTGSGMGTLTGAHGLAWGSDGDLYVSGSASNTIEKFDGTTGAHLGVFAMGGGLSLPIDIAFGPDDLLYVTSSLTSKVLRYEGIDDASPGAFLDVYASVTDPTYLAFTPEPTTISLLALGGLVLRRRRRR